MHWTTRYVYLMYWFLVSQGMNDQSISLATGLSHQTMAKLKNRDYGYFQSKTIQPLEQLVIEKMEEMYGAEL